MIKFARNNLKYQNVPSPPEHTANGNVHKYILLLGILHYRTCHSKQFSVGLMVLFNSLVYFRKIKKKISRIHQNYLVALSILNSNVRVNFWLKI